MSQRESVAVQSIDPAAFDLKATGLHKSFGKTKVLCGVDLSVRSGERVALIGSNGSGKSTLLRCCLRLIEPDTGELALLGEQVLELRYRALRRLRSRVGFVFQKHNLVPRLSVLSNVIHGSQGRRGGPSTWYQSIAPADERNKAMHCLQRVGLEDLAARRADQLSGGQSQRVAIARALMQDPELLLADEPVASLDPVAGKEVMTLMTGLALDKGITLVFTSHHLEHAIEYADRVVGLKNGRIQLDEAGSQRSVEDLQEFYDARVVHA